MKIIRTSNNHEVFVDDDDHASMDAFRWYGNNRYKGLTYAQRMIHKDGRPTIIQMHRLIMKAAPGTMIDHINGNGLDNQKQNLRFVTCSQNQQNSKSLIGSSKFKGVHFDNASRLWIGQIRVNGAPVHLGSFKSESAAALAYNQSATENFGEFARINEIAKE